MGVVDEGATGSVISFFPTETAQPRPMNGIFVAITRHELDVRVERQRRHVDDGPRDVSDVHRRLGSARPVGLEDPGRRIGSVISVSALPMSICPQAMSNARPSSDVDRVSPVIACFVAV